MKKLIIGVILAVVVCIGLTSCEPQQGGHRGDVDEALPHYVVK